MSKEESSFRSQLMVRFDFYCFGTPGSGTRHPVKKIDDPHFVILTQLRPQYSRRQLNLYKIKLEIENTNDNKGSNLGG